MKNVFPILFFAVGLFLVASSSHAGQAVLTWKGPVECADHSTLDNCPTLGFNIESSRDNGPWSPVVTTAPTATSYTVVNLTPGSWSFRLSTLTLQSVTSVVANADKPKLIPVAIPNPPSAVTVN